MDTDSPQDWRGNRVNALPDPIQCLWLALQNVCPRLAPTR
jgi:hypothetical protein